MTSTTVKKISRVAGQWGVTIGANVGSVYILDAVASAFGVGFVALLGLYAPGVFGLPMVYIIGFLVFSYGVWGYSLSKNLKANIYLLQTTGTSTNIFSKALYDFACSATPSLRVRHIAGSAGYIATELAKEIPYYVLAFGAAAASEEVTVSMSILFLAGANIGAAVYEYVLAFGTMFILPFIKK